MVEEATIFMTIQEVEAVLRREQGKVFVSSFYLDCTPPNDVEAIAKPYPVGYVTPHF